MTRRRPNVASVRRARTWLDRSSIKGRNLTQAQAAQILGASQPVESNLLNGHISGFSLERLVRFLNALDRDVEIVVKRRARSRGRAGVTVRVSG